MNSMFSPKRRGRTVSLLIVILAYVILQAMIMSGNLSRLLISLLVPVCAYIVAALGLNLNVGFSGELNLGQAGFMSIGAFTSVILAGILNANGITGIPVLILCILAGAAMAAAVGWLISVPVLKLQGDYLAIVTLAFGQIIMSLINNLYCGIDSKGLHFAFVTNTIELAEGGKMLISGPMGATGVSTVSTFTAGFILVVLTLLIVYNLIDSRSGRAITAARDNRIAAESIGISISRTKTLAFVISSCLGGAAGALYALNYSSFVATKFDFNSSILLLVYVVLGGLGNMSGTIISTAVLVVLPEMLRFLQNYRMLIYAVVLIVIMLVSNNEFLKTKAEQLKKKLSANRKKGAAENV
ncbi:MAG: branched-chain amino acid ABC transporter permease [Solobacterium sp.]|nr:branched-chain amino acid ABC transporter permease [Solobacterium sp.]MBQ9825431.1 branched-chain amino acid ABC transporter permease [Solobacterium sp.]